MAVYHNTLDGKSDYPTYRTASVGINFFGTNSQIIFANNTLSDMRGGIAAVFATAFNPATIPGTAFFNLISSNSLTGSYFGMEWKTDFLNGNEPEYIGHIGPSFRSNTANNIIDAALKLTPEWQGYTGGDFDQIVLEHNRFTPVPVAMRMAYCSCAYQGTAVATLFTNLPLYKNTFTLGSASFSGSKAFALVSGVGSSLRNLWRSGNSNWDDFETSVTADDGVVPTASVIGME